MNVLGKRFVYSAVPGTIHWGISGAENSGKSTLVAQLVRPGIVLVVDSDGRFADAVPENSKSEFYPVSDTPSDMIDVDKIVRILDTALLSVGDKSSAVVVDTLTKILRPIVAKIQAGKKFTSMYDFKPKADAMMSLRTALNRWPCETVWIYHLEAYFKEVKGTSGKKDYELSRKASLGEKEYLRLSEDLTVSLEVRIDPDTKRRGVYVKTARKGRKDFIYWDESGDWSGVRDALEKAIWGGITKKEQETVYSDRNVQITSPQEALEWAWGYSQSNGKFFKDVTHVENAYNALKKEMVASYSESGDKLTGKEMYSSWKEEVFQRELNREDN